MEAVKFISPKRFLCLLPVLFFGSLAFGDGCYIPERAIQKFPEISAQRAVLSWKDDKETLVISSALDSQSQNLGWIIPLPAVPETIEKQTPGGLKTLDFCIQPKITHDLHHVIAATIVAAILVNLILGTLFFKREYVIKLLVILMMMCIFWSLLLPAAGGLSSAVVKSDNLSIEKTVNVGSYEISILKASKLADLNSWLSENDFISLPQAANKTVEKYLSKSWVFAAIKLSRGEAGANAPHPIQMQFPSKEAVYPLQLTALAGGSPQFEIFVIADQKASCNFLSEDFCDRFLAEKIDQRVYSEPEATNTTVHEAKTEFTGADSGLTIAHSAIQPLMWDNCVLTKFVGAIPAEKMQSDLHFTWIPFKASRQYLYTDQGAKHMALISFVIVAGIWMAISMFLFRKKIRTLTGSLWYVGVAIVPVFVLFAIASTYCYQSLPKIASTDVQITRGRHHSPPDIYFDVAELLEKQPKLLQGSAQDVSEAILKSSPLNENEPRKRIDRITGMELKQEDSPGNFTVDREDDQILVRIYEYNGGVLAIKQATTEKPDAKN
jgi:hypothetical protein